MPRRAREAMDEIVLAPFAILVRLDFDLQAGAIGESAGEQPFDLDDEVVRLVRIDPQAGQPRRYAHPDAASNRRHCSLRWCSTPYALRSPALHSTGDSARQSPRPSELARDAPIPSRRRAANGSGTPDTLPLRRAALRGSARPPRGAELHQERLVAVRTLRLHLILAAFVDALIHALQKREISGVQPFDRLRIDLLKRAELQHHS